jgi:hypothetical protein
MYVCVGWDKTPPPRPLCASFGSTVFTLFIFDVFLTYQLQPGRWTQRELLNVGNTLHIHAIEPPRRRMKGNISMFGQTESFSDL